MQSLICTFLLFLIILDLSVNICMYTFWLEIHLIFYWWYLIKSWFLVSYWIIKISIFANNIYSTSSHLLYYAWQAFLVYIKFENNIDFASLLPYLILLFWNRKGNYFITFFCECIIDKVFLALLLVNLIMLFLDKQLEYWIKIDSDSTYNINFIVYISSLFFVMLQVDYW